jgi:alkyl sulfatase BDS1-like metallo-beta-lactamase superfamily hydrolase
VVTGTEEADLGVHLIIDDGRLAGAGLGPLESPDITFTLSRADAEELAYGTGDLNAGYMQGRVKVAGDPAHLLSLLRLAAMPAFKSWLGAVAAALGR